ncbi:MAG: cyclic pyranopterin monophosphate synthase MoaC [Anaerolineales bacterium]
MTEKITHLDASGSARMVDVADKSETERIAIAKGEIVMQRQTLQAIQEGNAPKGDVLGVAKIAGIMAAKNTSHLIPLCHPLMLDVIRVDLEFDSNLPGVQIRAEVKSHGKTGVEMEALTAVSVAALTVYDMAKALEKTMRIQNIRLVEKHGGKSGDIINV